MVRVQNPRSSNVANISIESNVNLITSTWQNFTADVQT